MRTFLGRTKGEDCSIDVMDIKRLLSEKITPSIEIPGTCNQAYGIAYQLKKYAGIDTKIPLNCTLEHGAILKKIVCQIEVMHHAPYILTFSQYRKEVITNLTEHIPIAIGPYIAYAEDYRSKEYIDKIKQKYGKILLVMPSHSTAEEHADFDIDEFIKQIEIARKGFDTVMVCVFFHDLILGREKQYKKKKYKIVSAGKDGNLFLSRMKYILSLCDAVLVNGITTGIAYALYMGKPVQFIKQNIDYNKIVNNNFSALEADSQVECLQQVFYKNEFVLAEGKNREYLNYLFGFSNIKTKEEMKNLLLPLLREKKEKNGL